MISLKLMKNYNIVQSIFIYVRFMIKIISIKQIKKKLIAISNLMAVKLLQFLKTDTINWETRGLDVIRDHLILIF